MVVGATVLPFVISLTLDLNRGICNRKQQVQVLWRNWLARPAVNREVESSSLSSTVVSF